MNERESEALATSWEESANYWKQHALIAEAQLATKEKALVRAANRCVIAEQQLDAVRGLLNTEYAERKDACNDPECEICIEWFAMFSKLQAALNGEEDELHAILDNK